MNLIKKELSVSSQNETNPLSMNFIIFSLTCWMGMTFSCFVSQLCKINQYFSRAIKEEISLQRNYDHILQLKVPLSPL